MTDATCSVDGCETKARTRGLCSVHYHRARRRGECTPLPVPSVLDRLLARSVVQGDCLVWTGGTRWFGYGCISVNDKTEAVHRLAWIIRHGPIPPGMFVCHHCDNPPCWADDHLFLGTNLDNTRDRNAKGRNPNTAKTYCKRGHPYDEENTYIWTDGSRGCRACGRIRDRARWPERKAQRKAQRT